MISRRHCRKFRTLAHRRRDGEATEADLRFLEAHRLKCESCASAEASLGNALNLLRESAWSAGASTPGFERRVLTLRRFERAMLRRARPWTPALAGAIVAAMALLAVLQVVTHQETLAPLSLRGHEASRLEEPLPAFPELRTR